MTTRGILPLLGFRSEKEGAGTIGSCKARIFSVKCERRSETLESGSRTARRVIPSFHCYLEIASRGEHRAPFSGIQWHLERNDYGPIPAVETLVGFDVTLTPRMGLKDDETDRLRENRRCCPDRGCLAEHASTLGGKRQDACPSKPGERIPPLSQERPRSVSRACRIG